MLLIEKVRGGRVGDPYSRHVFGFPRKTFTPPPPTPTYIVVSTNGKGKTLITVLFSLIPPCTHGLKGIYASCCTEGHPRGSEECRRSPLTQEKRTPEDPVVVTVVGREDDALSSATTYTRHKYDE